MISTIRFPGILCWENVVHWHVRQKVIQLIDNSLESPSVKIVSLGPTTSAAVRSEGLEVSAQAASPGTESLVAAVREALD